MNRFDVSKRIFSLPFFVAAIPNVEYSLVVPVRSEIRYTLFLSNFETVIVCYQIYNERSDGTANLPHT